MVVIKGFEMPKCCDECKLMTWDYGCAIIGAVGETLVYRERSKLCPLVETSEHGDLIDRDALYTDIMDRGIDGVQLDDWSEIQQAISDAPTVIP